MKKRLLTFIGFGVLATAPQMYGAIATQLFLDAGGGQIANITVDSVTNLATCAGVCGGFTTVSTTGAHKQVNVIGNIGQFSVNFTGRGGQASVRPTLENFNQLNAKNTGGAGTLSAIFSDTSYTDLASQFTISVSGVQDSQISSSTANFAAYANPANVVPGALGAVVGGFLGQTGPSYNKTGNFANPIGTSGTLTESTILTFTGAGTLQANFTIANVVVPEPASAALFGGIFLFSAYALRKKFKPAQQS